MSTRSADIIGIGCATRSLLAFGLVGAGAALLHYLLVSLLVPLGIAPLLANIAGFCAAFCISFAGHSRWTFPGFGAARPRALRRFLGVALSGFAANESLYAVLLRHTSLDYRAALVIVLSLVAGATFLASKYWAFANDSR